MTSHPQAPILFSENSVYVCDSFCFTVYRFFRMTSSSVVVSALAKLSTPVCSLFLASFYLGIQLFSSDIGAYKYQHGSWPPAVFVRLGIQSPLFRDLFSSFQNKMNKTAKALTQAKPACILPQPFFPISPISLLRQCVAYEFRHV